MSVVSLSPSDNNKDRRRSPFYLAFMFNIPLTLQQLMEVLGPGDSVLESLALTLHFENRNMMLKAPYLTQTVHSLSRLPMVEHLVFSATGTEVNDIVEQLSLPRILENAHPTWLCPRLHTMVLDYVSGLDVALMVRMVKERRKLRVWTIWAEAPRGSRRFV